MRCSGPAALGTSTASSLNRYRPCTRSTCYPYVRMHSMSEGLAGLAQRSAVRCDEGCDTADSRTTLVQQQSMAGMGAGLPPQAVTEALGW